MRIVGLDLSLTRTGIALPDGQTRVLRPPKGMRGADRMVWIRDAVMSLCGAAADVVAIETVFQGTKGDTAMKLSGLGWIVRVALYEAGIPYVDVGNSTLKRYATGKGGGPGTDKLAMVAAARTRLGYDTDAPDDNEADALWLRALASAAYRQPVVDMPRAQTDSCVKAIVWPRVRGVAEVA
jgi:Holliday junction resolvasome RuvABC endonuclease subunit